MRIHHPDCAYNQPLCINPNVDAEALMCNCTAMDYPELEMKKIQHFDSSDEARKFLNSYDQRSLRQGKNAGR